MALQNNQGNSETELIKKILLSFLAWILLIPFVTISFIYRSIVNCFLKLRFGELYGGIVDQADGFFFMSDVSKLYITTVLYVKSETKVDLLESFRKTLKKKVFDCPHLYPKLTSSKHSFAGYSYWLKFGCELNDVLVPLKVSNEEFNDDYLKKFTGELIGQGQAKNDSILWDIHVSQIPLKENFSDGYYRYPIVTRFHHAIADGTSLIALLIRLFGDEKSQNYGEELFKKLFKSNLQKNGKKFTNVEKVYLLIDKLMKIISLYVDIIFLSHGRLIQANQLKPMDINALHASNYTGDKIVAWSTEEQIQCLPLVKQIKNKTNSKFVCVLNTAITASITNYFNRNNLPVPDNITGALAMILTFPDMDNSRPVPLENKATAAVYEIPTNKSKNLTNTLRLVTERMNQQLHFSDVLLCRFMIGLAMGYIPSPILNSIAGYKSHTFVFSNVPGGSQIKVLDGCVLEKLIPFAPNFRGVGISFALVTYDERLQVGVLVDKKLIQSQKEVQKIADDIFHYIKLLDNELKL